MGKRSAGKLHAAFDEAGAGNGLTAPALDPTTDEMKCINHITLLGISTTVTQKLLEHSSPDLTNKVYMNVDPVLRRAVDQISVGDWL